MIVSLHHKVISDATNLMQSALGPGWPPFMKIVIERSPDKSNDARLAFRSCAPTASPCLKRRSSQNVNRLDLVRWASIRAFF